MGTHVHNITLQLDGQIAVLDLSDPSRAPVDAIAPLVEAQIPCLEAAECTEPMDVPEALEASVEKIQTGSPDHDVCGWP